MPDNSDDDDDDGGGCDHNNDDDDDSGCDDSDDNNYDDCDDGDGDNNHNINNNDNNDDDVQFNRFQLRNYINYSPHKKYNYKEITREKNTNTNKKIKMVSYFLDLGLEYNGSLLPAEDNLISVLTLDFKSNPTDRSF
jgi:hypothetical protein